MIRYNVRLREMTEGTFIYMGLNDLEQVTFYNKVSFYHAKNSDYLSAFSYSVHYLFHAIYNNQECNLRKENFID